MLRQFKQSTFARLSLGAALFSAASALTSAHAGTLFTETNAVEGNEILAIDTDDSSGRMLGVKRYASGGFGSGGGLGSQAAVTLDQSGRYLLAVNAGSDSLSVFRVGEHHLVLTDVEDTLGTRPISVATHGKRVYVLNAGSDSLSGFVLGAGGQLSPIAGASASLSGVGVGGAQVGFSADGDQLIVTEKATNQVLVYAVGNDGTLSTPSVYASPGMTPFGFDIGTRDLLYVSEAAGGAPGASTLSSYRLGEGTMLKTLTAAAPTGQAAACWAITTADGRFVYTTNTASGTVSAFSVGPQGSLTLLDEGVAAMVGEGAAPIDAAFSPGDEVLYVLDSGNAAIAAFKRGPAGALHPLQTSALPAAAVGLAAN